MLFGGIMSNDNNKKVNNSDGKSKNTAKKVLESGKADCLLYLKGDTLGGQEGKIETVPIYLLEKLNF